MEFNMISDDWGYTTIDSIKNLLSMNVIVAIGDIHSDNTARTIVDTLLRSGTVQAFAIEFPDINGQLNQVLKMAFNNQQFDLDTLNPYFNNLNRNDATPTILDLTKTALSNNVAVCACDLSIKDPISTHGMNSRDKYAKVKISHFFSSFKAGKLVLWGDMHFRDKYLYVLGDVSYEDDRHLSLKLLPNVRYIPPEHLPTAG